jgi:hypothetical protein
MYFRRKSHAQHALKIQHRLQISHAWAPLIKPVKKYKRGEGPLGRGGGLSSWPGRKIRKLLLSAERTHMYVCLLIHINSCADISYFLMLTPSSHCFLRRYIVLPDADFQVYITSIPYFLLLTSSSRYCLRDIPCKSPDSHLSQAFW